MGSRETSYKLLFLALIGWCAVLTYKLWALRQHVYVPWR